MHICVAKAGATINHLDLKSGEATSDPNFSFEVSLKNLVLIKYLEFGDNVFENTLLLNVNILCDIFHRS